MSKSKAQATELAAYRILQDGRVLGPMPWVLAILMFITVLAAAAGLAMGAASQSLNDDLAHRLTIQIVEANPDLRHAQADAARNLLAALPSVAHVELVNDASLDRLVAPWLGTDGEAAGLPYPSLIDVTLRSDADVNLATLKSDLQRVAPAVQIEPDLQWLGPLENMLTLMTLLAIAIVFLLLIAVAAAVILSARAALNTHRATIDILHLMGASDRQISALFQRQIAIDALISGTIGLIGALVVLFGVQLLVMAMSSELFGAALLQWWAWGILATLPLIAAILANFAARATVMRALRKML